MWFDKADFFWAHISENMVVTEIRTRNKLKETTVNGT
jgi:hypothetical protein